MFGKEHFGHLADMEDRMEEGIGVTEGSQAQKIPIHVLKKMLNLTTF